MAYCQQALQISVWVSRRWFQDMLVLTLNPGKLTWRSLERYLIFDRRYIDSFMVVFPASHVSFPGFRSPQKLEVQMIFRNFLDFQQLICFEILCFKMFLPAVSPCPRITDLIWFGGPTNSTGFATRNLDSHAAMQMNRSHQWWEWLLFFSNQHQPTLKVDFFEKQGFFWCLLFCLPIKKIMHWYEEHISLTTP